MMLKRAILVRKMEFAEDESIPNFHFYLSIIYLFNICKSAMLHRAITSIEVP